MTSTRSEWAQDDRTLFERRRREDPRHRLVTGPTGSGKTTTLYAGLGALNTPDKTIVTIEDPVEYELEGIKQVQVNAEGGLSFPPGCARWSAPTRT